MHQSRRTVLPRKSRIECALAPPQAGQDSRGLRKIKPSIGLVTTRSHRYQPVICFSHAVRPMQSKRPATASQTTAPVVVRIPTGRITGTLKLSLRGCLVWEAPIEVAATRKGPRLTPADRLLWVGLSRIRSATVRGRAAATQDDRSCHATYRSCPHASLRTPELWELEPDRRIFLAISAPNDKRYPLRKERYSPSFARASIANPIRPRSCIAASSLRNVLSLPEYSRFVPHSYVARAMRCSARFLRNRGYPNHKTPKIESINPAGPSDALRISVTL
jgi:hypothetical protein